MTVDRDRGQHKASRAEASPSKARQYHSPRRDARAAATRAAIAAAARRLFIERGWAGTTVRDVASAAGVAEPTVYATFGSKTGLASAVLEAIESAADVDRQTADLTAAQGDPTGELAAMVGFDRRLYEQGGDVLVVMREAGRSQPELASAYAAGRAGADRLRRRVLGAWPQGALRDQLELDEAVDVYAAICNVNTYRVLTEERAWTPDRVESWLHRTVCELILA